MDVDPDRTDDAVLALLYLGLHDDRRAWGSFDRDAMERLTEFGGLAPVDQRLAWLPYRSSARFC